MKRWVAVGFAFLAVFAFGGWLVWRAFILPPAITRVDTASALHNHITVAQQEAVGKSVDQWVRYMELIEKIEHARVAAGVQDASRFEALWTEGASAEDRRRAAEAVESLRDTGLFEVSKDMAAIDAAARPWAVGPDEPLVTLMFEELWQTRFLLQAQLARWEVSKAGEKLDVLRETLEVCRLVSWQGSMLDHTVSAGSAKWVAELLRDALRSGPVDDDAWLQSADRTIAHALGRWAPVAHALEGDRLVMLDSLQFLHTDRGRLRPDAAMGWSGDGASAVTMYRGPLSDSVHWLDELTEAAVSSANAAGATVRSADARLEAALDRFTATGSSGRGRWPALFIVLSDFQRPIRLDRTMRITLAGTRVAIAIERHRLAHGTIPESLDAPGGLLPAGLDVDPVTEQPWVYKRAGEGYTLSSRALPGYEAGEVGDEDADADPLAGVPIVP